MSDDCECPVIDDAPEERPECSWCWYPGAGEHRTCVGDLREVVLCDACYRAPHVSGLLQDPATEKLARLVLWTANHVIAKARPAPSPGGTMGDGR